MATDRDVLPNHIKPLNYNLSLSNLQFSGNWQYDGVVNISSKVQQDTDEIVLNVKDVKITDASVYNVSMKDVSYDEKNQRATIKLSEKLKVGKVFAEVGTGPARATD